MVSPRCLVPECLTIPSCTEDWQSSNTLPTRFAVRIGPSHRSKQAEPAAFGSNALDSLGSPVRLPQFRR